MKQTVLIVTGVLLLLFILTGAVFMQSARNAYFRPKDTPIPSERTKPTLIPGTSPAYEGS